MKLLAPFGTHIHACDQGTTGMPRRSPAIRHQPPAPRSAFSRSASHPFPEPISRDEPTVMMSSSSFRSRAPLRPPIREWTDRVIHMSGPWDIRRKQERLACCAPSFRLLTRAWARMADSPAYRPVKGGRISWFAKLQIRTLFAGVNLLDWK